MDILYLGLTIALFVLSWGFVRFCAALVSAQEEKK